MSICQLGEVRDCAICYGRGEIYIAGNLETCTACDGDGLYTPEPDCAAFEPYTAAPFNDDSPITVEDVLGYRDPDQWAKWGFEE